MLFCFLPFILFGKNSIITIHDNLDQLPAWLKMFQDNNLFFKIVAPTKAFENMSTLYYGHINFSFQCLLYYFFDGFTAYTISYNCSIILGFFSMFILLKRCFDNSPLILLVSVCYAVMPAAPFSNIAFSTVPFIIFAFFSLLDKKTFSWKALLLFFFPFFSSFTMVGIFILGFWLIGGIVTAVKNKRLNSNLLVGFIVLCLGYIIVDLKLFYLIFFIKEPLNRTVFSWYPSSLITMLKTFLFSMKSHFINGHYHAASKQRRIILPIAFVLSIFLAVRFFASLKDGDRRFIEKIKNGWSQADKKIKLLFICELLVLVFSGIAALYDSALINNIVTKFIPVLAGFNWGRVWIFNRVLWYVIFALCLDILLQVKSISFDIGKKQEPVIISHKFIKNCTFIIIVLQLVYILAPPVEYNDHVKTWLNEFFIKTGIAGKFTTKKFDSFISYKEFYAEDLFAAIKNDIDYTDERVVAFGYHPSVLMYNGFNCIDGYNNVYPLKYMQKFRTLIAPELEINDEAREYYDSWGGRMYLYNSELSYEPTRNKDTVPTKLNIDMNVFRNDFNGKYILSRAEISNVDVLGLDFINRYFDEESIYTIYLYAIKLIENEIVK
jgi:hypothetical protein